MEGQGSNSVSSRPSKLSAFTLWPINITSPLFRYLHGSPARSPLAPIENFRTPPSRLQLTPIENFQTPPSRSPPVFEVEEDVVVMDGILVGSVPGGKGRSSSGSSGSNCWHSPRAKVPHGKEELRPPRLSNKKRFEEKAIGKVCKFTSPGSCSHGAKCPFVHHCASESESPVYVRSTARPEVPIVSPMKLENSSKSHSITESFTLTSSDWSPLDDGIDVSLPSAALTDKIPSREAVNSYIDGVLYGLSQGKRLPIFVEICPE